MLGKGIVWDWDSNPARQQAWDALKAGLCKEGNALKRADPTRPYFLHTDWSKDGLSAILGQQSDAGQEYLVACLSRSNNKHERNYGSYKGEMLAAVWGIRSFRHYLYGCPHPFTLLTDHKGLTWLMTNLNLEGQYARWACLISEFDFVIKYKPGSQHAVADAPSRGPSKCTRDTSGAREPPPEFHPHSQPDDLTLHCALSLFTETEDPADFLLSAYSTNGSIVAASMLSTSVSQLQLEASLTSASQSSAIDIYDLGGDFPLFGTSVHILPDTFDVPHAIENTFSFSVQSNTMHLQSLPTKYVTSSWHASLEQGQPHILSIDSSAVPDDGIITMLRDGVSIIELFGGICAGLEMCLRSNIQVNKYF